MGSSCRRCAYDVCDLLKRGYLIDGSIRKSNVAMRIAVRLIRADDGYVIWSETYDRPISDRLRLQDDIAAGLRASHACY